MEGKGLSRPLRRRGGKKKILREEGAARGEKKGKKKGKNIKVLPEKKKTLGKPKKTVEKVPARCTLAKKKRKVRPQKEKMAGRWREN